MIDDVDVCSVAPTAEDVARAVAPDDDGPEPCATCGEAPSECVCGAISWCAPPEEIEP